MHALAAAAVIETSAGSVLWGSRKSGILFIAERIMREERGARGCCRPMNASDKAVCPACGFI